MAGFFKLSYDVYIQLILLQKESIVKNEDIPFKKNESVNVFLNCILFNGIIKLVLSFLFYCL